MAEERERGGKREGRRRERWKSERLMSSVGCSFISEEVLVSQDKERERHAELFLGPRRVNFGVFKDYLKPGLYLLCIIC